MNKESVFNFFTFFIASLVFISVIFCYISPSYFSWSPFLTWSLPFWLFLNLGTFFWGILKQYKYWYISLVVFVLTFSFLKSTFQITFLEFQSKKNLNVLSYNTRVFNVYSHLGKKEKWQNTKKMTKWIVEGNFDIMCFQEFYYEPNNPVFNTIKNLKAKNSYYHYFYKTLTNNVNGQFGMAIFSKYKIIKAGKVKYDDKINNQILYADIKYKGDTLRIYNVHLLSNNIEDKEVPESELNQKNNKKIKNLVLGLKNSFALRAKQVRAFVKHLEKCPYQVMICGDFNDLPTSYTYRKILKNHKNTFEEKGSGFGITYNGKIPFLRIDNIFVSENISVKSFKTHQNVKYSDHFPISSQLKVE